MQFDPHNPDPREAALLQPQPEPTPRNCDFCGKPNATYLSLDGTIQTCVGREANWVAQGWTSETYPY